MGETVMFQQMRQHGGDQRQHRSPITLGGQQQRRPMRIIRPALKVDLQPAVDWFFRLATLGFWGGVAGLIVWAVLYGRG
jgi:hypothetical protein